MYLCHKCSGVLHSDSPTQLYGCQCISGYIRGFEPNLTEQQAAIEQIKQELEWLALKASQGCPDTWTNARLVAAMFASNRR